MEPELRTSYRKFEDPLTKTLTTLDAFEYH
jgi:hypothetical protein